MMSALDLHHILKGTSLGTDIQVEKIKKLEDKGHLPQQDVNLAPELHISTVREKIPEKDHLTNLIGIEHRDHVQDRGIDSK